MHFCFGRWAVSLTWACDRMCVLDFFCQVLYGLEEGETASPEHLENCKKMANLNFIDNHKAPGSCFCFVLPGASTWPIFFAFFWLSNFIAHFGPQKVAFSMSFMLTILASTGLSNWSFYKWNEWRTKASLVDVPKILLIKISFFQQSQSLSGTRLGDTSRSSWWAFVGWTEATSCHLSCPCAESTDFAAWKPCRKKA